MFRRSQETLSEILVPKPADETPANLDMFSRGPYDPAKRHETYRIEDDGGLGLPVVIRPAMGDGEDFFATVATYYQDYSPISALMHVLVGDTAGLFAGESNLLTKANGHRPRVCRVASLGLSLGEAVLAGLATNEPSRAPDYAACRRTLAFSLCRAKLLYPSTLQSNVLAERWVRLRKLSGLKVSPEVTDAVLFADKLGSEEPYDQGRSSIDPTLRSALREIVTYEPLDRKKMTAALSELYPGTSELFDRFRGKFDERMSTFTWVVEAIQANSRGIGTDEIAVAFACNSILPGSFAHTGVLASLVDFFPAALVWYGMFSALSRNESPQQVDVGLLAKLERDLLEEFSFSRRPLCDISLDELEVLSRIHLRAGSIKPSQQRAIFVALLPGVNVYTRFGMAGAEKAEVERRASEVEDLNRRAVGLIEDALYTLRKVERMSGKVTARRKPRKNT